MTTRQISLWAKMASSGRRWRPLGEDGVAGDDGALQRQRLQQPQRRRDLVAIRVHRQLADHAGQGGAERRQQADAGGVRRGAAAQPLAVDRDMARRLPATDPSAERPLQSGHVQPLEQLAPYRWCWDPAARDAEARQRVPRQPPAPAHDPQLVAPARQQGRHGNQQQPRQRIPLARRPPAVRHRRQGVPETARYARHRFHPRPPPPDSHAILNRAQAELLPPTHALDTRTESPWLRVWNMDARAPGRYRVSAGAAARRRNFGAIVP